MVAIVKRLIRCIAAIGLLIGFLPSAPALTTQGAIPVATDAQATYAYDANPVYVASCNALTDSDASQQSIPSFGPVAEFLAAKSEAYFIENGVRRSVVTREAGGSTIEATIYREGQSPVTETLRLDQLHSPKPEIPVDTRYLNIQPPIQTPIQVQPLGLPGQGVVGHRHSGAISSVIVGGHSAVF